MKITIEVTFPPVNFIMLCKTMGIYKLGPTRYSLAYVGSHKMKIYLLSVGNTLFYTPSFLFTLATLGLNVKTAGGKVCFSYLKKRAISNVDEGKPGES